MGDLKYLVIHCTATPEGRDVTKEEIITWHTAPKPKGRGWSRAGYSDLIMLDGSLVNIMPFDQDNEVEWSELTNGAIGINGISRHIVYAGGCDKNMKAEDTRTEEQLIALETYVKYTVLRHPEIKVAGHNQFANKACPSFDTIEWLKSIGIKDKNINK